MIRKTLTLIPALAAVAALVPATAGATELRSAPTLRGIEGGRIQLKFAVDKTLPSSYGKVTTKITVNGRRVEFLKRSGRHGRDYVYTALADTRGLKVGSKYKVRFRFASGTVTRLSKYLD